MNEDFKKKWRRAGYYMVLLLCVAAVGVSGYVFVTTAVRQSRQSSLSAPLTTQKPEKTAPTGQMEQALTPESAPEQPSDPLKNAAAPVEGEILRQYDAQQLQYDPTYRDWRLHSAVDIAAEGQTVRAVMDGIVESVGEDEMLGCVVTVTHDGGYVSRYGCLAQGVSLQKGDAVKAGDAIGTVGTGLGESALAPHLHFELLKDGQSVDPTPILQ